MRIQEQRCKEIYARQGHKDQFSSEAERDQWLQKEIRFSDRQISETREQIESLERELEAEVHDDERCKTRLAVSILTRK